MEVFEGFEIGLEESKEKINKGSKAFVFPGADGDVEFIRRGLKVAKGDVQSLSVEDIYPLIATNGSPSELASMARRYEEVVIVCPHGNTSGSLAKALSSMGVKAYSLKGGIERLKGRSD